MAADLPYGVALRENATVLSWADYLFYLSQEPKNPILDIEKQISELALKALEKLSTKTSSRLKSPLLGIITLVKSFKKATEPYNAKKMKELRGKFKQVQEKTLSAITSHLVDGALLVKTDAERSFDIISLTTENALLQKSTVG